MARVAVFECAAIAGADGSLCARSTLFRVADGYTYVDPCGKALGYEDVFTKLENATRHYQSVGFGADHLQRSCADFGSSPSGVALQLLVHHQRIDFAKARMAERAR